MLIVIKKFKKPNVISVKLDFSRVILLACRSGGIYMEVGPACIYTGTFTADRCWTAVRGQGGGATGGSPDVETAPS